jgi:hypothetical protein
MCFEAKGVRQKAKGIVKVGARKNAGIENGMIYASSC